MKSKFAKNSLTIILVICACILLAALLFACDGSSDKHTLKFIADGETVKEYSVQEGTVYEVPDAPEKDGYTFVGWFDDPDFGADAKQPDYVMPAHDVTFYAKYAENIPQVYYNIEYYVQQLGPDGMTASDSYTRTRTYGSHGSLGSTVSILNVTGQAPTGFVYVKKADEVLSLTLGEDSNQNVLRAYYDRITLYVDFAANGGSGEMDSQSYPYGAHVPSGNIQNAFTRDGYRFAGFVATYPDGSEVPSTADSFVITDDVTFTAQWHRGYQSSDGLGETVYYDGSLYYRVDPDGTRHSAQNRASSTQLGRAYDEFVFEEESADVICRIYADSDVYEVCGEEAGLYVLYDHVTRSYVPTLVLLLNGFGYATYNEIGAGSAMQALYAGSYMYSAENGDYVFEIVDPLTNVSQGTAYFELSSQKPTEIDDSDVKGSFVMIGGESGQYGEYIVRTHEGNDGEIFQLFGNGYARMMGYDSATDSYSTQLSEGVYYGTENHVDYMGEWFYQPLDDSGEPVGDSFKFMLNAIVTEEEMIPIFMHYDPTLDVEFAEEGESGGKLVIGGYNGAEYTIGGTATILRGAIAFLADSNIRFTPYNEEGEARTPIDFDLNWSDRTFKQNTTGLLIDENGILTGYTGSSTVVAITDDVREIADGALAYGNTGVSLTHVTVPATVTKLGARAFENNYTLMSVVFGSATPIEGIDWSPESDPFRWPMTGAFRIYVPDDALVAYKSAWADCPYKITSVEAETNKPEFEVDESGVLLSYNSKAEDPRDLSITLPDEVKSVADGVFAYIPYIASVDLNNATSLGEGAFEGCSGLKSVTAGKLEMIGASAFALCTSLESVSFPAAREVGAGAFSACEALIKASFGASLERIGDRAFSECATGQDGALFVLEFADGADVPNIGGSVFYGCFGYRVSVATVEDALALYDGAGRGWSGYASRATVRECETSAIVGVWVDAFLLTPAEIGGRVELPVEGDVMIYSLDGSSLTFYRYDSERGGYDSVECRYSDGVIEYTLDYQQHVLVRAVGERTYESYQGETLVVDLSTYEAGEVRNEDGTSGAYSIRVNATFGGVSGTIVSTGGRLTLPGVEIGGIKCDLTLTLFSDDVPRFRYTKTQNDVRGPYVAIDGSEITVTYYSTSSVCLTGKLQDLKGSNGAPVEVTTLGSWYVSDRPADDTYVVRFEYLSSTYFITVTIDDASKTFTYTVVLAATRKVLTSASGARVVLLLDVDGATIRSMSLLLPTSEGGSESLYVRSFTLQSDGSYLVEAEQRDMVYDPATESYKEQLGSLSGSYSVTLDIEHSSCTVAYVGALSE